MFGYAFKVIKLQIIGRNTYRELKNKHLTKLSWMPTINQILRMFKTLKINII